jgi:hypothetical protein
MAKNVIIPMLMPSIRVGEPVYAACYLAVPMDLGHALPA